MPEPLRDTLEGGGIRVTKSSRPGHQHEEPRSLLSLSVRAASATFFNRALVPNIPANTEQSSQYQEDTPTGVSHLVLRFPHPAHLRGKILMAASLIREWSPRESNPILRLAFRCALIHQATHKGVARAPQTRARATLLFIRCFLRPHSPLRLRLRPGPRRCRFRSRPLRLHPRQQRRDEYGRYT